MSSAVLSLGKQDSYLSFAGTIHLYAEPPPVLRLRYDAIGGLVEAHLVSLHMPH